MSPATRLILSLLSLMAVFLVGTAGYIVIEVDQQPTVADAAYMTAITLSTVGFDEVWELSPAGRLWTMGVITVGYAAATIAFTLLITLFVSGELRSIRERRKMTTTIQRLRDHVILCGYGRMGALAATEIAQRGIAVLVIETDRELEPRLVEESIPYIIGDATDEKTLANAHIENARALVAALPHDADNVYITLAARSLNADLDIIARAEQPISEDRLIQAGATRVVSPKVIGAFKIANILTRPNVVDFVEVANKGLQLEMDEFIVDEKSPLLGGCLRDSGLRESTSAIVVAIKRADGETLYSPQPDVLLECGDTLIMVGPSGISLRLQEMARGF